MPIYPERILRLSTASAPSVYSQTRWTRLHHWMRLNAPACVTLYAFFFALTITLQIQSGTYSSEFGHEPDEPAHVVSALMVHDYVASRFPGTPMHYAETYYLHYPKV